MEQNYVQRGYLHEDFRLFHLRGAMEESVDWHYHTFHKIIEFLGGESVGSARSRPKSMRSFAFSFCFLLVKFLFLSSVTFFTQPVNNNLSKMHKECNK